LKHIVITGSSRGIGKALALEFLKKGCSVIVSGRNQDTLEATLNELIKETGNKECRAIVCDVSKMSDLKNLWDKAAAFHPVDFWINNAGTSHGYSTFHLLDTDEIDQVIKSNISGTMYGSKVAIEGMLVQGKGSLFNMEGFGSDGRKMEGMSIYGTSKNATRYFSRSLAKEYRKTNLHIGTISPGMVVTDLLLAPLENDPEKNKRALKIFHILADPADRVAPWLAGQILNNQKNGAHIAWLTPRKMMGRFLTNMFKKRKVKGLPEL
jgi:short-subunit dehydrogenase